VSYELRVIRGEHGTEDNAIPADVWLSLVRESPDLRITGAVEATTPAGHTVRYENEHLAEWTGHPSGTAVPFDFREGHVVVKNPDEPTIARLIDLAAALGGRVQGDEGEWYDKSPTPPRRQPRRRR
jgi:hypothetical protein